MATSFAIEVPGGALPLTEQMLYKTLLYAVSNDQQQIRYGTQQLQQWEKSPRFYVHLQSVFLDRSLVHEIRYLAIIQLKNGIDKYWRKTATNAVSKEDKDIIRSRLVQCVLIEPDRLLARQNALVYSKIVRFEFPNEWPDAITSLLPHVHVPQDPNLPWEDTVADQAVTTLLQIIKELSTGRLAKTRAHLQAASPAIFTTIRDRYVANVDGWRILISERNGTDDTGISEETRTRDLEASMKGSMSSIKALRRLLITGYEHPNRDKEVSEFWSRSIKYIGSFIELRGRGRWSKDASELLEKHMLQLAKLHHEMARDHPAAFGLLPGSLQMVWDYWAMAKHYAENFPLKLSIESAIRTASIGTDGHAVDMPQTEKVVLRGMSMIRACLKMIHYPMQTFKYQHAQDKEERAQAIDQMKRSFESRFVQDVMQTIVTRYFILRAKDLYEWQEDPEEWENNQEVTGEDFDFNLRSCAEKLFLDLAINYKEVITQPLLAEFHSVSPPTSDQNILYKDAVYCAVGLAASTLHEQLDFDAFIRDRLRPEVWVDVSGWNILRRRAAVMLAQWISVKTAEDSKPIVYEIFQLLLTKDDSQPLNDLVVRITAGRQLKHIIDDWEFKADRFKYHAPTIITNLMALIEEVESIETKMALLSTVSVIVERMEYAIAPFAELISNPLPSLYNQAGDEHLMKQVIFTLFARLVNALRADSHHLQAMVVDMIRHTLIGGDMMFWLLEDSLDLWASILAQLPEPLMCPELLTMTSYMDGLYELGGDTIHRVLEIANSYILLAPDKHPVLGPHSPHRATAFQCIAPLINTLKPEPNGLACTVIENSLRVSSAFTNEDNFTFLASELVTYQVLPNLLTGLHGSYIAHCTTHGPNASTPLIDGVVETDHLAIIARLIIGSTSAFSQAIAACAPNLPATAYGPSTPDNVMRWLLEEMFSHFENVGDSSRRKLLCLALTKLLETNQDWILLSLQSLMTMWTDVIVALREQASDQVDGAVTWGGPNGDYDPSVTTAEEARKEQLDRADIVNNVSVDEWVQYYLRKCVAANANFEQEWVANVDKDVVAAFGALGIV